MHNDIADKNNNKKAKNSAPILNAINNEYAIANITPHHSKKNDVLKNIIFRKNFKINYLLK